MLKLLVWGIIGYFVYRYFQSKLGLMKGGESPFNRFRQPPPEPPKKEEEGEYIDYEEIKQGPGK